MRTGIILVLTMWLITPAIASEFGEKYKPYECKYFQIGDTVTYGFYWRYWTYKGNPDFVGDAE